MADARARSASTRPRTNTGGCSMSAMTRAAERLVVCGTKGVNKMPEGCWYELVLRRAQAAVGREPTTTATARSGTSANPSAPWRRRRPGRRAEDDLLPAWLTRDAAADPKPASRTITPSSASDDEHGRPRRAAATEPRRCCAAR